MPSTDYWVRYDTTGKYWEESHDAAHTTWAPLIENPTVEVVIFDETAAPAVSAAGHGKMYFDSTAHRLRFSEDGSAYSGFVRLIGDTMTGILSIGGSGATANTTGNGRLGMYNAAVAYLQNPSGGSFSFVTDAADNIIDFLDDRSITVYGNLNSTGDLNVSSTVSGKPAIALTNTNADSGSSCISFAKYSASPADSDQIGNFFWYGYSDTAVGRLFARHIVIATDVSNTTEDASQYFQVIGAGSVDNVLALTPGEGYFYYNCSALSYTDRTPYPKDKQEAYDAINSVEGKDGKLDHAKLHPSLLVEGKKPKDPDNPTPGPPEVELGRNLSMTVSALTEVMKDLIARIDVLEKK
jgi:hypothetical protein